MCEGIASVSALTYYLCPYTDTGQEESILVLQGLGVQTSTSSSYFLLSPTTTFIPTTQIQDIVIHEAFKGFEVRFFLAIIVTGATEVVVVFPVRELAVFLSGADNGAETVAKEKRSRGGMEGVEEMSLCKC